MIFVKRIPVWSIAITVLLILAVVTAFLVVLNRGDFSWVSMVQSLIGLLLAPRLFVDYFYIPKVARLIVDEEGIRLEAKRFSWSYSWEVLDCAYMKNGLFSQSLNLNSDEKVERIVAELNQWKAENGDAASVLDAVEKYIPVKTYTEMPVNQHALGADLGPAAKQATIVIGGIIVVVLLGGMFTSRYYPLGDGTPVVAWLIGGALVAGATLLYLYNNYAPKASYTVLCLLGFVAGAFGVPALLKSYIVLANDVEVHRFELIEKDGGYQQWRSLENGNFEIELGSVSNTIHTENDPGAIVKIALIDGGLLTLLLPNELEKTRYKVAGSRR